MTTNLLIAYPSILREALSITSNATYEDDRPLKNIVTGGRQNTSRVSPALYQPILTITMASGNEKQIEYMIVAKANLLAKIGGTRLYVKMSNPMTETDAIGTLVNLQTRTFLGPKLQDLIFTSSLNNEVSGLFPTVAARQFRFFYGSDQEIGPEINPFYYAGAPWVGLRNSSAENDENEFWYGGAPAETIPYYYGNDGGDVDEIDANWEFSKLYMGMFFDFGRDPLYPRQVRRAFFNGPQEKRPHYEFDLTWRGISHAKLIDFETKIVRYMDVSPVFLYTQGNHALLQGDRLVHCQIVRYKARTYAPNNNQIDITFQECL